MEVTNHSVSFWSTVTSIKSQTEDHNTKFHLHENIKLCWSTSLQTFHPRNVCHYKQPKTLLHRTSQRTSLKAFRYSVWAKATLRRSLGSGATWWPPGSF
jgi:hypothetical protein